MDISTEGDTSKKTCIMVDENDKVLRIGSLVECHTVPMMLHRAFSVFIFDSHGRLLLQQRAKSKYTFPLSWTNSICSHPRDLSKSFEEWIDIRLQDEFDGWTIPNVQTRLKAFGKLLYEATSDNKYGEKELDTLFYIQVTDEEKKSISMNKDEIEALLWLDDEELETFIRSDRNLITPWFRSIYEVYKPMYKVLSTLEVKGDLPTHRAGNVSFQRADESHEHLLQLPFSYLCSNPGKQVRTMLCNAYGQVDVGLSTKDLQTIASIVERIHAASLLHDDIEDKSLTRRGAPCAHLIYGTARVINTGCYNYFKAMETVEKECKLKSLETRYKMTQTILQTLETLHRAQGADILWAEHNETPSRAQYLEMIDGKTGALFQLCAKLGGICSDEKLGALVADQFKEFGRFFQIRDDFANICDPVYWKGKGFYEDADEGKKSYPVILFLDSVAVSKELKEELVAILNSEQRTSNESKLKAYTMLHEAGILAETRKVCVEMQTKLKGGICSTSTIIDSIMKKLTLCDVLDPESVKKHINL